MYGTGLYAPYLIFNMDETAFELSSSRRVRRVAPRTHPRNGQAVPPSNEHITSMACIGIDSASFPPFTIYHGAQLQKCWSKAREEGGRVRQLAITTNSDWINSYVMLKWLEDAFDPFTRDTASGRRDRRLLILDGAEPHTKVDFLEACWARNIVVLLLPAKMCGRFQPLDVDFFNTLKAAYHRQVDAYQLGSSLRGWPRGCFGAGTRGRGGRRRPHAKFEELGGNQACFLLIPSSWALRSKCWALLLLRLSLWSLLPPTVSASFARTVVLFDRAS